MLNLFGPRLKIDADELEFQLATFKWLEQSFGPVRDAPVLPTPAFFPPSGNKGDAKIADLFGHVKDAAGMADWPCELQRGAGERPAKVGLGLLLNHEGAPPPAGTFSVEDGAGGTKVVISWNPGLADDPTALIATFAHELGHYLLSTAETPPPGGWSLHELHTDLAAVHLGFGIFLANSARNFGQFQSGGEMGWAARTQGYLSEQALVTALAIVQRLAGRDLHEPAPYLKDYLRSDLKRTAKALARRFPDMKAAVAAVDLSEFAADDA